MKQTLLVVLGLYVFMLGAFVHRQVWSVDGVEVPWGLLLVLAATYATVFAAGQITRIGGACLAVGWAVGLLAVQYSPTGSYLVASDWLGWAFTAGCLGVIVLGVVRPPRIVR